MYDQMTIEDAVNVVRVLSEVLAHDGDEDVRELVVAAKHLVRQVEEQACELERERARRRGTGRNGSPVPDGDPLLEGRDSGGRRDFLAGRPVHAGDCLYLLTCAGWHGVRYEFNVQREPVLYMPLPGVREDVVLAVPREARFTWPGAVPDPVDRKEGAESVRAAANSCACAMCSRPGGA